jgi:hypothetical protein
MTKPPFPLPPPFDVPAAPDVVIVDGSSAFLSRALDAARTKLVGPRYSVPASMPEAGR